MDCKVRIRCTIGVIAVSSAYGGISATEYALGVTEFYHGMLAFVPDICHNPTDQVSLMTGVYHRGSGRATIKIAGTC
jgi:hypothetical protein